MRVCYITDSYFILPFSVKLLLFNVTLLRFPTESFLCFYIFKLFIFYMRHQIYRLIILTLYVVSSSVLDFSLPVFPLFSP